MSTMAKHYNKDAVKQAAAGRWGDVLSHLAGIPGDVLDVPVLIADRLLTDRVVEFSIATFHLAGSGVRPGRP